MSEDELQLVLINVNVNVSVNFRSIFEASDRRV